jgi:hypothetical protein
MADLKSHGLLMEGALEKMRFSRQDSLTYREEVYPTVLARSVTVVTTFVKLSNAHRIQSQVYIR